jgi:predicted negative regulator of RcsB-dependent stress response
MSEQQIRVREFVVATAAALVLGVVLSLGAIYGLNQYFHDHDVSESARSARGP